jgi:hypothetical protein
VLDQVTRPKVESVLPSELVKWAKEGRIRIPSFQRSYRWDRHDVTELFESVLRGYPIGNLLMWQRPATAAEVTLGHLHVHAAPSGDAYWVVDGQQRIISLVGALTATEETVDPRFRIYFALDRGEFVSVPRRQMPYVDWLPIAITLNTAAANAWIRARPHLDESQIALADQVIAAIRDYKIPMYVVTGDDEAALRDIFDRMNTYGKPMRSDEVFNALHALSGERQPSDLHTLADGVQTFGFGSFSDRLLMQSLLAIRGAKVDRDFRKEFKDDEDLREALARTETAIGHVVDFLREFADIPHIRLLPYSLCIPILARFVNLFGSPEGRAAELLRRWIWRGAVLGMAPQGNTIGIRRGAAAVYSSPVDSAGRLLLLLPSQQGQWEPDLSQIRLNRAQTKINILGMLSRRPRLLPGHSSTPGEYVDTISLLDEGQIFTPIISGSSYHATSIDNQMIYPHRRDILKILLNEDIEFRILESHCITPDSLALLRSVDVADFLRQRATATSTVIRNHVQERALFGFRDGPDLDEMFEDGEGHNA